MGVTRRRFIGLAAGAAAGTLVGRWGGRAFADLGASIDSPIRPARGRESVRLSVCRQCPGGCGVRVRCIEGRAVKVDGNRLHPVSAGRLCPKGQASLQALYHPDRVSTPLRRAGPRGSIESFRPSTWDEALQEISVRLSLLRQQARPEALVLLRGSSRGLGPRLASRFLRAFGSPNDVVLPRGDEAAAIALQLTQGIRAVPAYDLQSAEHVLSFGSSTLEAASSPVYAMRAYGKFRQGREGRRGKWVHVAPRQSLTGAAADEWVAVRPGTEGILALGIAAVLVAENLHDAEFVTRKTRGFEDAHGAGGGVDEGLRRLLERDFPLERVSAEAGVSVNRILRLAREFAAARPGLAIGPRSGPTLSGQLFDHLAVHVLNALAGNIDAPGGVLVPETAPPCAWPEIAPDALADAGLSRARLDGAGRGEGALQQSDPERLADALLAQDPYEADALIVLDADPAFVSMAPDAFAAALERVPLVVSLATLPTDTSLYADWILPTAHPFEAWDEDLAPPGVPFPLVSVSSPVVGAPAGDVRSSAEVFLELARRIGGPIAAAFPWADVPALIRSDTDALFAARRGAVIGTDFDEAWVRLMERAGWWAPGYRSADELWSRLGEAGGWWDPMYEHGHWNRVLCTESKCFELRPDILRDLAEKRRARQGVVQVARARSSATDRGLALVLFEPLATSGGSGAELPFLQASLDPTFEVRWSTWVEVHPETARELGVADRTSVRVSSPYGWIDATALVTERVVPGVAAIPVGLGRRGGGRWASGIGANPLRLVAPLREAVSALPDVGGTRVQIAVESGSRPRPAAGARA